MRHWLAVFTAIMVLQVCIACQKNFVDPRALRTHLRYCKKNANLMANSMEKRRNNMKKAKAAKIRRVEDLQDVEEE